MRCYLVREFVSSSSTTNSNSSNTNRGRNLFLQLQKGVSLPSWMVFLSTLYSIHLGLVMESCIYIYTCVGMVLYAWMCLCMMMIVEDCVYVGMWWQCMGVSPYNPHTITGHIFAYCFKLVDRHIHIYWWIKLFSISLHWVFIIQRLRLWHRFRWSVAMVSFHFRFWYIFTRGERK